MKPENTKQSHTNSYAEVYIWLGRNKQGKIATAAGGGITEKKEELSGARCGHAALGLFNGRDVVHISLWDQDRLFKSIEEDQAPRAEGGPPDVIIRLHHLDIPKMLQAFNEASKRVSNGKINWTLCVSKDRDITNPGSSKANCATFVYSFLKVGGFGDPTSRYSQYEKGAGPKGSFYYTTKCDLGEIFGGIFNGAPWANANFTPKALLLRVAAAAEAYPDDIKATIEVMKSSRVAGAPNS